MDKIWAYERDKVKVLTFSTNLSLVVVKHPKTAYQTAKQKGSPGDRGSPTDAHGTDGHLKQFWSLCPGLYHNNHSSEHQPLPLTPPRITTTPIHPYAAKEIGLGICDI